MISTFIFILWQNHIFHGMIELIERTPSWKFQCKQCYRKGDGDNSCLKSDLVTIGVGSFSHSTLGGHWCIGPSISCSPCLPFSGGPSSSGSTRSLFSGGPGVAEILFTVTVFEATKIYAPINLLKTSTAQKSPSLRRGFSSENVRNEAL